MAKVKAKTLLNEIKGSTATISRGSHEADGSGVTFQQRKGGIVIQKKISPTYKCTERQKKQRNLFCFCDTAYQQLTDYQKQMLRKYASDMNKKTRKNWSMHTWWMHLCMHGNLNEFLEKYLGLTYTNIIVTEKENEICYKVIVKPLQKTYIDDNIFLDVSIKRR